MVFDTACFAGVPAALRSAAVLRHHSVHHVPDLVGHEQRARLARSPHAVKTTVKTTLDDEIIT